jgi:hypothetical protein
LGTFTFLSIKIVKENQKKSEALKPYEGLEEEEKS